MRTAVVAQQSGQTPGGLVKMPGGSLQRAPSPDRLAQLQPPQQSVGSGAAVPQRFAGMNPTWTSQRWVIPNGTIVDPGSANGSPFVNGNWQWANGTPATFGPSGAGSGGQKGGQ